MAGDYRITESHGVNHGWNYDPKRKLFVDLTQDQFAQTKQRIVIATAEESRLVYKAINTFLERHFNLLDLFTGESFELYKSFIRERNNVSFA